jgi:hypothetical protein
MNKIDLIIDSLRLGLSRCPAREMGHFEQALAAAHELKALKPVMTLSTGTKLYALDEEQA